MSKIKLLFISLRPKQWIKNLFIFVPLIFFGGLFKISYLALTGLSFLYFCLVSSAVYLINDVIDRERDKLHPLKSMRPITQGKIPPSFGVIISGLLLFCAFFGIYFMGNSFIFVLAMSYFILNICYSFFIKNFVILDVIAVALGFELRIWVGSATINIEPSAWLQVFIFLLALFISFAKRRDEILLLRKMAREHRKVLSNYHILFINQLIAICGGIIILAYALYTLSGEILKKSRGNLMIYTVPFVVYGVFRYLYLMYIHKEGGDPTEIVFSDKPLVIDLLLWSLAVFFILYL